MQKQMDQHNKNRCRSICSFKNRKNRWQIIKDCVRLRHSHPVPEFHHTKTDAVPSKSAKAAYGKYKGLYQALTGYVEVLPFERGLYQFSEGLRLKF